MIVRHVAWTVALILAATIGPFLAGTAGAANPWTVSTLPSTGPGPWLPSGNTVSCPPGTAKCVVVGGGAVQVESPSATTISPLPLPTAIPPGGQIWIDGLSCPSINDCVAVGADSSATGGDDQGVIETEIDGSWTASIPDPSQVNDQLDAVSCPTAGACVAVGVITDYSEAPDTPMIAETLIDGTWQATEVTLPGTSFSMTGISCISTTSCVAVGSSGWGTAVAETLSGTTWTAGLVGLEGSLGGVSCQPEAPLRCVAVGSAGDGSAQIEALSRGTWTAVGGIGIPGEQVSLSSVSCPSPTACQAVGSAQVGMTGDFVSPLDVQLAGSVWTAAVLPGPAGAPTSDTGGLGSVSCAYADQCTAVGWVFNNTDDVNDFPEVGFIQVDRLADGQWTPGGLVGPPASSENAVSCPAAHACVAVGSISDDLSRPHPLIAVQTGTGPPATGWILTSLPSVTAVWKAVSCGAPGSCVAVGDGPAGELAGGNWTTVAPPLPAGASRLELDAVSCPAAGWCVATGWAVTDVGDEPVVEEDVNGVWSETVLSLSSMPYGISCPAIHACVVLAWNAQNDGLVTDTLTHGSWTGAPAPWSSAPESPVYPTGLSCSSLSSCVASGFMVTTPYAVNPDQQALVMTIDNGTSTAEVLANGGPDSYLSGVSCLPAGRCVAVGWTASAPGATEQALVETLAAGSWSATTDIDPEGTFQVLAGVSCLAGSGCTATGTLGQGEYPLFATQPVVAVGPG